MTAATDYVALLRGINVGKIRIAMPDLRNAMSEWGYPDTRTVLATGNLIFTSPASASEVKEDLQRRLSDRYHYEAFVLLRTQAQLRQVVESYPFPADPQLHSYVVFTDAPDVVDALTSSEGSDPVADGPPGVGCVYWQTAKGATLTSTVGAVLAKPQFKSISTTRNLNTVRKLLA